MGQNGDKENWWNGLEMLFFPDKSWINLGHPKFCMSTIDIIWWLNLGVSAIIIVIFPISDYKELRVFII